MIAVVTEFPLGDILRNKEANGHIIKWAIELGTYSIEFRSRPTIKSHALADFVAEWTKIQEPITATCPEHWVMYFDGALNINGASVCGGYTPGYHTMVHGPHHPRWPGS